MFQLCGQNAVFFCLIDTDAISLERKNNNIPFLIQTHSQSSLSQLLLFEEVFLDGSIYECPSELCALPNIKPAIFVLCLTGTYCNSASACFVASDGKNLRLYQAVVDARKLLDELSDPETSVSIYALFCYCSLQCDSFRLRFM